MGFWLKVDFQIFFTFFRATDTDTRATDTDENVYIYYFKKFPRNTFYKNNGRLKKSNHMYTVYKLHSDAFSCCK